MLRRATLGRFRAEEPAPPMHLQVTNTRGDLMRRSIGVLALSVALAFGFGSRALAAPRTYDLVGTYDIVVAGNVISGGTAGPRPIVNGSLSLDPATGQFLGGVLDLGSYDLTLYSQNFGTATASDSGVVHEFTVGPIGTVNGQLVSYTGADGLASLIITGDRICIGDSQPCSFLGPLAPFPAFDAQLGFATDFSSFGLETMIMQTRDLQLGGIVQVVTTLQLTGVAVPEPDADAGALLGAGVLLLLAERRSVA